MQCSVVGHERTDRVWGRGEQDETHVERILIGEARKKTFRAFFVVMATSAKVME